MLPLIRQVFSLCLGGQSQQRTSFFFRGEERGVPLINPSAECMQTAERAKVRLSQMSPSL